MEYKSIMVSSDQFVRNLLRLKIRLKSDLLSDMIIYECKNCNLLIPIDSDGVIQLSHSVDKTIGNIIQEMTDWLIASHTKERKDCSNMLCIHENGTPKNILFTFPESDSEYMKNFTLLNDTYTPKLLVTKESDNKKSICVLYQKESVDEQTYSEFIKCNFSTHLNCEEDTSEGLNEDLIYDDESVHYYQHKLPRIFGGGRKLSADYNYECIWCPKEVVRLGKKGRFREYRSYRDHFKAFHHSEKDDGGDLVPMADFLDKVHRIDPKWFCKGCGNHYSLGSVVYHKSVCKQPEEEYSESESDNEDMISIAGPSNQKSPSERQMKRKPSINRKKLCIYSDSSSEEKEPEETESQILVDKDSTPSDDTQILEGTNDTQTENNPKRAVSDESFDGDKEHLKTPTRRIKKKN